MRLFILAAIFLIVSLFFSMLGIGGGMFYVPILLFAKFSLHTAAPLSLSLILATSFSALFVFLRNKLVDWKLAAIIDPPTDIMAFVGGYFAAFVSEALLRLVLVFVLVAAGVFMMKKGRPRTLCPEKKVWWCWERIFCGRSYRVNLLLTLPFTAAVGLLSGMLGVTGGVIKLPLMVLFCGVPMDIAIATSTVMVAVTALFGLGGHIAGGGINIVFGIPLAIAAFIGGQVGSRISIKGNKGRLKKIFGFALIVIAVRILFSLSGR